MRYLLLMHDILEVFELIFFPVVFHSLQIYATDETAKYLNKHYIQAQPVSWPLTEDANTEHPKATK